MYLSTDEALKRREDLKLLYNTYRRLHDDITSSFYKCKHLAMESSKLIVEINNLSELIYNGELDDSYDQNTGEVHKIYKNRGDWL